MICTPTHYCSVDEIVKNEMGGACSGYRRAVYRILVGKPEGKRPSGRSRHGWEDNIKMVLQKEIFGGNGLDRACLGLGDLIDVAEKENKEPIAYEVLTVKLGLSLSFC